MSFKKDDVIETKMFGDKLYFCKVVDPNVKTCIMMAQDKIPDDLVGMIFFYENEASKENYSKYKQLYPENVI